MRDIMEMSHEAHKAAKGSVIKQQELFAEMLFAELMKMKGADIAPHLTCNFDVIRHEYKITLSFPLGFNEKNAIKGDIK